MGDETRALASAREMGQIQAVCKDHATEIKTIREHVSKLYGRDDDIKTDVAVLQARQKWIWAIVSAAITGLVTMAIERIF